MAEEPEDIPEFLSSLPGYVATVRYAWTRSKTVHMKGCVVQENGLKTFIALQIPDEFTEYFNKRSGIDSSDPRL